MSLWGRAKLDDAALAAFCRCHTHNLRAARRPLVPQVSDVSGQQPVFNRLPNRSSASHDPPRVDTNPPPVQ